MEGAAAKTSKQSATQDVKAQNKKRNLEFRAQHGLVVAFFVLILYAVKIRQDATIALIVTQNLSSAGHLPFPQWISSFATRPPA